MSNGSAEWTDDMLEHSFVIPQEFEGLGVPYGVQVIVFKSRELLQKSRGNDEDVCGYSVTYDEGDSDGVGALIAMSMEDLELSIAVHEAAHVMLFWAIAGTSEHGRVRPWLRNHPESLVEGMGNLSALLWWELLERTEA